VSEDRENQETLPLERSTSESSKSESPKSESSSESSSVSSSGGISRPNGALKGRYRLLVEKGRSKGLALRLRPNGDVTVGREESNQLTLSDAQASRKHFRVLSRLGEYTLTDLDSSNGTYVNGERITSRVLRPGDKIHVGDSWVFFLEEEGEGERKGALTGQEFNGYRIGRLLGRGGMGTVYEAQQLSLERTVAMKVLSPELARDPQFIERFLAEARAAGRLSHANIVAVFDVGQHDDLRFYSMEYMSGGSLEDLLRAKGPIPPLETVPLIFDAARGLEYAERHGVIHRDIKPDNLMLGPNQAVKICDLGIATFYDPDQQQEVSGSPHYLAPEHAQGKAFDHRVDLYSLGVSWYQLLCGEPPYGGRNAAEIIRKHIDEEPPPLKERVPDLPREIDELVQRLMAKDPEQRLPSARQLQVDLAAIARKLALRETITLRLEAAAPNLPPSPGLAIERSRRRPVGAKVALGVAALVVLSCVLASVVFAEFDDDGEPVADRSFTIRTTGNLSMGQNEKLTALGSLLMESVSGIVTIGDVASVGALRINAPRIDVLTRTPGTIFEVDATQEPEALLDPAGRTDNGTDIVSGVSVIFGSSDIRVVGSGTQPEIAEPTGEANIRGIQTRASNGLALEQAYFNRRVGSGGGAVSDETTVLDIRATGSTTVALAESLPNVNAEDADAFVTAEAIFEPNPDSGELAQGDQGGILLRRTTPLERKWARDGVIWHVDLAESPMPGSGDFRIAAARLNPEGVVAFRRAWSELAEAVGVEDTNREEVLARVRSVLGVAVAQYKRASGEEFVDPQHFALYSDLRTANADAWRALRLVSAIAEGSSSLGLTQTEAVRFRKGLVESIRPEGLDSVDLARLIEYAGQSDRNTGSVEAPVGQR